MSGREAYRGRMELIMRLTSLLAVAGIALLPVVASAQPSPPAVPAGTRIFVTSAAGGPKVEGALLSLSADSVALLVEGDVRTMPLDSVKRIERAGDSSIDGAVIGALLVGGRCARVCGQGLTSSNQIARAVLTTTAVGAVVGWWVDRNHVGRTRIYPLIPDRRDTHPRR